MSKLDIAVIIQRRTEFRYLGSVIESAMCRGHRVVLWHDYSQPTIGVKGYQFPSTDCVPNLSEGKPSSTTYNGKQGLTELLERNPMDWIVASRGPSWYLEKENIDRMACNWISVQENVDYLAYGLECIIGNTIQCLHTSYWLDLIPQLYAPSSGYSSLTNRLHTLCRFTGCTQADGIKHINPSEIRSRWKIPTNQPVVVYLPSVRGNNLFSKVFLAKNKFIQCLHILRATQWRNLSYLFKDAFSDQDLVESVRKFCNRNGAFLLVKTREKQPLPPYLESAADRIIMDESEYPASILSALSVADLCISAYFTYAINDAAVTGVPFVSMYRDLSRWSYSHKRPDYIRQPAEVLYDTEEGSYFNRPGFSYAFPILEGIQQLQNRSLSDFPLNRSSLENFVQDYLGCVDGKNGERVVKEIESLVV